MSKAAGLIGLDEFAHSISSERGAAACATHTRTREQSDQREHNRPFTLLPHFAPGGVGESDRFGARSFLLSLQEPSARRVEVGEAGGAKTATSTREHPDHDYAIIAATQTLTESRESRDQDATSHGFRVLPRPV
jgi:hypothetical protein